MPPPATLIILGIQCVLLVAGLVMLWRYEIAPIIRRQPELRTALLPAWNVSLSDFFLFLWLVMMGGFAGGFAVASYLKSHPTDVTHRLILGTAGMHAGLLLGVAVHRFTFGRLQTRVGFALPGALSSGMVTFLIAHPIVTAVSFVWQLLLKLCGYPVPPQDAVDLLRHADSVLLKASFVAVAVVLAPITEELIFRSGIFRYMRTRVPRGVALFVPAVLFALLHLDLGTFVPLVALAVVFSLAYERTGNIGTTIVAHCLFNLNTTLAILVGVDS